MKYEELNNTLLSCFPELKPLVDSEMNTFDCYLPGPHVLYGNVFNPYVKGLLKSENDLPAIKQVFTFFEELANSEDEEVRNLLQVTLLEALWDEKNTQEKARKYMQVATKQTNKLIGDYLKLPTE